MADEHSDDVIVSAETARRQIAAEGAGVLDIRSDDDWNRVGNIPGAVRGSGDDPVEAARQIDDDSRVIVVCTDGSASAEVAEKLRDEGRDAVSIDGGMATWEDKQFALQPTADLDLPGEGDNASEDRGPDADASGQDADADGDNAAADGGEAADDAR